VGPEELVTAIGKVRRAFDVNSFAQVAALASLDQPEELARRRAVNAEGLVQLARIMGEHGLQPPRSVANFLFAEVGEGSRPLFEQLLREGVIVRPAGGFGAPGAIRVTVGTSEENELFGETLGRVLSAAAQP
jgi:histidinol-phosphate aminotransferase